MGNIVEELRKEAINKLFETNGFAECWPKWKNSIVSFAPLKNENQIFNLGDHLKDIFFTTNGSESRSQSSLASGGANWEALVCWYLNLCLIGRRTVVLKHSKALMPSQVSDAITVNYSNFVSNTESDLIALTFPDLAPFQEDVSILHLLDMNGHIVPNFARKSRVNTKRLLEALMTKYFDNVEIHIIQCKTNWNDNAQIPMLWDMVYSATDFSSDVSIGKNGYSIDDAKRFTYSFVTVPTVNPSRIKVNSTQVKRVTNLSGGNYWGMETKSGVAKSVKEMLTRNLQNGASENHLSSLKNELPFLTAKYPYFKMNE